MDGRVRKNRCEKIAAKIVGFPFLGCRAVAIGPRGRDSRASTMKDRCHGSAIRRSWPGSHRRSLGMSRAFHVSQPFPRKYRGSDDDDNEARFDSITRATMYTVIPCKAVRK